MNISLLRITQHKIPFCIQICLFCVLCTQFLYSQGQPKSYIIAGITVEGNRFADEQTIIAISGLQVGAEIKIPGAQQQEALRSLWSRNQFSDVDIVIEKTTALGIFLVIRVKEYPRLSWFEIKGNDELSEDDIRKEINKSRGDVMSPYDIYVLKKTLKKAYAKEGVLYPVIDAETIMAGDTSGYVKVVLNIKEGADFKVKGVKVRGNVELSESDIAGALENTHASPWWKIWTSDKYEAIKYAEDKEKLIEFFRSKGYLDAEIRDDTVILVPEKEAAYIELDIYEGKKYFVRNVIVEGNTVFPSEPIIRRVNVNKGDVYDEPFIQKQLTVNEDQTDAASLYMDNGYLGAQLVKEEKKVGQDSIDLVIRVFENERYTIRRVEIVGNTKTKDKVIRRELYTRPGDYFNRSALIRSVRGLGVLNYFNPEALRPDVKPADKTHVDLVYKVEERSNDTFNASVGVAGSFGLTGSVGITLNNFSLAEPLRGGGGQVLNLNLQFGQANQWQDYSLSFTEPWLNNEPTTLGVSVFHSVNRFSGFNQERTGGQLNLGRRLRWPDDYFRVDGSLLIQHIQQFAGTLSGAGGLTDEITLSASVTRISLDNLIFPTAGSRFNIGTQVALGAFGIGKTDYIRNSFSYETVSPLLKIDGNPRLVLYLSTTAGYIAQLQTNSTFIPDNYMYLMGGNGLGGFFTTPLRGYPDNSIGILSTNAAGQTFSSRGRVVMRHVLETRFALSLNPMPIYFLAFAEAGNIWSSLSAADPFDLRRSAGMGMRILLNPIGLLGFDYGFGFDPTPGTSVPHGWQFHFQFGR